MRATSVESKAGRDRSKTGWYPVGPKGASGPDVGPVLLSPDAMPETPTAENRDHVERALAVMGAPREELLRHFDAGDGAALAAMLREAAMAYTDVVVRLGATAQVVQAGQALRLRYDSLQWMFDFLVRAAVDRDGRPG